MKSVKGEVLSATPISISKAAKILSKFVYADTGASQAVCAYLRRASASFNELNQLHKELKSHRKHKITKSKIVTEDGEPTQSFVSNHPDGEASVRKNHNNNNKKKTKKKKKDRGWVGDVEKNEGETVVDKETIKIEESDLGVETEKSKHEKKRREVGVLKGAESEVKIEEDGNVGIEDDDRKRHEKSKGQNGGKIGYLEEQKNRIKIEEDGDTGMENVRKKHKKKRESDCQVGDMKENGGGIVVEEEEEERRRKKKKRKSDEIKEGRETKLEEFQSKKKKKRKIEGVI